MGIVVVMFSILLGVGLIAVSYLRDELGFNLKASLKIIAAVVGVILIFGLIAMNTDEDSLGELLLILAVPGGFILFLANLGNIMERIAENQNRKEEKWKQEYDKSRKD